MVGISRGSALTPGIGLVAAAVSASVTAPRGIAGIQAPGSLVSCPVSPSVDATKWPLVALTIYPVRLRIPQGYTRLPMSRRSFGNGRPRDDSAAGATDKELWVSQQHGLLLSISRVLGSTGKPVLGASELDLTTCDDTFGGRVAHVAMFRRRAMITQGDKRTDSYNLLATVSLSGGGELWIASASSDSLARSEVLAALRTLTFE